MKLASAALLILVLISNQKEFQNLRLQGEKTNELKALINLKSSILCSCSSSDCHIGLHIGRCKQQKSGTNKTCSRISDKNHKPFAFLFYITPIGKVIF